MQHIRVVDVHAYNYICAFGRKHWVNTFVEEQQYDILTNNVVECTNSLLKDTRVLPIIKHVEEIRVKLMEFFQKCHINTHNVNTLLIPYVEKIMSHETEEARWLHVYVAGLIEFQVQSTGFCGCCSF